MLVRTHIPIVGEQRLGIIPSSGNGHLGSVLFT